MSFVGYEGDYWLIGASKQPISGHELTDYWLMEWFSWIVGVVQLERVKPEDHVIRKSCRTYVERSDYIWPYVNIL